MPRVRFGFHVYYQEVEAALRLAFFRIIAGALGEMSAAFSLEKKQYDESFCYHLLFCCRI